MLRTSPRHSALTLVVSLLVAQWLDGCALSQPKSVVHEVRVEVPISVPTVLPTDAAARELLACHVRLRRMSLGELAVESRQRDEPAPGAATCYALALMMSHASGELLRAQNLLEQVLNDARPDAAPWQPLARLLADVLTEQRRLDELAERQGQQLRDQQRRLDAANEKLEALKAIERSLGTPRNTPGDRK